MSKEKFIKCSNYIFNKKDLMYISKDKITLTKFWESDKKLAIHCNTEEEAKKLLMAFDKLGKKWCDGDSYAEESYYNNLLCSSTCYSNDHRYGDYEDCKKENYIIYEFEDVDLEN